MIRADMSTEYPIKLESPNICKIDCSVSASQIHPPINIMDICIKSISLDNVCAHFTFVLVFILCEAHLKLQQLK